MLLRKRAKTMDLFEFVATHIKDRWNHHQGNGYRELAAYWYKVRRKNNVRESVV